jgi:hypothetical protein
VTHRARLSDVDTAALVDAAWFLATLADDAEAARNRARCPAARGYAARYAALLRRRLAYVEAVRDGRRPLVRAVATRLGATLRT